MPYNNDDMIYKMNHIAKKKKEAEKVIEKLSPYLEGVGPVDSLKKLLHVQSGRTVEEKIVDYFLCGGNILDFYDIIPEQRVYFLKNKNNKSNKSIDNIYNNSLKSKGAKTIEAKVKKKRVSKVNYKALLLALLATAAILMPVAHVGKEIYEEVQYERAIEGIEDSYLLKKGYELNDLDTFKISYINDLDVGDFKDYLESLDLHKHDIIYITYMVAGYENTDKLCREYYNASFDKIIRDDFPFTYSNGKKIGDLDQLANHCQKRITEKGIDLSKIIDDYKEVFSYGGKH